MIHCHNKLLSINTLANFFNQQAKKKCKAGLEKFRRVNHVIPTLSTLKKTILVQLLALDNDSAALNKV